MVDIVYYIYAGIMSLLILFFLGVIFILMYKRRQIIHFEVLDEETMRPVTGLDVYGEYTYSQTERGFTATGEPVFYRGAGTFTGTKKIGRTDENGVFKRVSYIGGYGCFFFNVENPNTKFPNFFTATQLQLNDEKDKIKTIVLDKKGKMKLLNPNKTEKNFKFKIG